jgi:uroporphyrinogen-III synthase
MRAALKGKTIVVTRAKRQARQMVERIESYGGEAYLLPLIEMRPPQDLNALDGVLDRLGQYQVLLFTSVNGVAFFLQRLRERQIDFSRLEGIKLIAVGPKTKQALTEAGLRVHALPEAAHQEGLFQLLLKSLPLGSSILFPRGNLARPFLGQQLRKAGYSVEEVDVYQTIYPEVDCAAFERLLLAGKIHALTFTSPSTVKHFINLFEPLIRAGYVERLPLASIGPVTSREIVQSGLPVSIEANPSTVEDLVDRLVDYFLKEEPL